ncbi:protein PIGBOS1 [Pyxicephalus adspersus]
MMYRKLPFHQLSIAVILGVVGGVYIYKPLFQKYVFEQRQLKDANVEEKK